MKGLTEEDIQSVIRCGGINFNGAPLTIAGLELILTLLARRGSAQISNVGNVSLMMLAADLAGKAVTEGPRDPAGAVLSTDGVRVKEVEKQNASASSQCPLHSPQNFIGATGVEWPGGPGTPCLCGRINFEAGVLAERERCAKIADFYDDEIIAEEIRQGPRDPVETAEMEKVYPLLPEVVESKRKDFRVPR